MRAQAKQSFLPRFRKACFGLGFVSSFGLEPGNQAKKTPMFPGFWDRILIKSKSSGFVPVAAACGKHSRLDAAAYVQLLQNVGDVMFDGFLGKMQLFADFAVCQTPSHQFQDFSLSFGEFLQGVLRGLAVGQRNQNARSK